MMCSGSIFSCCPYSPHGHERALKEDNYIEHFSFGMPKIDYNKYKKS